MCVEHYNVVAVVGDPVALCSVGRCREGDRLSIIMGLAGVYIHTQQNYNPVHSLS